MTASETDPDDLVTTSSDGPGAGYRTDLYIGPIADADRYELLGPPMRGGEGTTWRARYRGELDQPVQSAIKVLHRPHAAGPDWPTVELMRAWRDRVELLHSADLPHVVRLLDVEVGYEPHRLGVLDTARTVLIRMEWVAGPTLSVAVGAHPATRETLPRRLDWIDQLCAALGGLHVLGTAAVHRDVTPSNCIVTSDRGLVLIDLSTMQLANDGADPQGRHTPLYSAPEVISDPNSLRSAAADRWSIGAIAFYCLTGVHPPRDTVERAAVLRSAATRLRSPAAAGIVLEMLEDAPDRRPHDLPTWSARLRSALLPAARPRRRRLAAALVAAAVVIAAAVALPPVLARVGPSSHGAVETMGANPDPPSPTVRAVTANGASATITAPGTNGAVAACVVLRGTVDLPSDTTIVLAQRLDEAGDPGEPYVEFPAHWDTLTGTTPFAGVQYFNDATTAQHLLLQVVAVDRDAAKRQFAADTPETDHAGDVDLVEGGTVLDSVRVTHSLPGKDTGCSAE